MPMSLRLNPQRKEAFEQGSHRPAKRAKTTHSSPVAPAVKPPRTMLFPKLHASPDSIEEEVPAKVEEVTQPEFHNVAMSSRPTTKRKGLSLATLQQHTDLNSMPIEPEQQILWLLDAIGNISGRSSGRRLALPLQPEKSSHIQSKDHPGLVSPYRGLGTQYRDTDRQEGHEVGEFRSRRETIQSPVFIAEHVAAMILANATTIQQTYGERILYALRQGTRQYDKQKANGLWAGVQSRYVLSVHEITARAECTCHHAACHK